MTTITFDTHAFVKKLKDAGFSETQAEAVSEAQRDSLSQALDNQLATKADIIRLENKLEHLELRLTLKMGGMMVVSIGIIATLIKLL